jgi:NDP-4-keto-2,6-dideoxyhexose 3-C-methyltransferase
MVQAIYKCRACGSPDLIDILDLGDQYLSDFRRDNKKPPKYPLVIIICNECKLVQLRHTTPPSDMYHERYGFKSGINEVIKADLGEVVDLAFQYNNDPQTWLDIASNDGTLLSFVPEDIYRVGVDPVRFLCEEAREHADVIVNDYFSADVGGEYDVITSVSCFYDMPDPNQFVRDVNDVLADGGVWIIQQNYLLTTIQLSAVDNFCHEHLEYYTLYSLERLLHRFGLEINSVLTSPINGGSIRAVVTRVGTFEVDDSVHKQRAIEEKYGIVELETYIEFSKRATKSLLELVRLVRSLKRQGKSIHILGASTRGSTIWQAAKIDERYIDYVVERNPAKVGAMFSAIGVRIIGEEQCRHLGPDYMLIGPWFLAESIMERERPFMKQGAHFILPLPKVQVI